MHNTLSLYYIALAESGGSDAAKLELAKEYVKMYGLMGSTSNTMLFQDKPADTNSLMAQVATVLASTNNKTV